VDGLYNLVKEQYPNAVVKGRDLFDAVLWSDATSTSLFYTFLANLRNEVLNVKETSSVHKFIRTLADTGRLLRCYTQNIDGLEEREGLVVDISHGKGKRKRPFPLSEDDTRSDQEKGCQVVQLHGDLKTLRCTNCQLLTEYSPCQVATLLSGAAPVCSACETASVCRQAAGKRATKIGLLRPNVVLYGEEHPEAEMVGKLAEADISAAPDLMIIMGTSLKVHGLKVVVKQFAKAVHAKGGLVVFINNTAPPESVWNDVIDMHVQMDCDAWVADVKSRRAGIWERQTTLIPKIAKTTTGSKKASIADKENIGAKKRKVLEPKTPSKGRSKKALDASKVLQETPYMSPPFSPKKRHPKELDVPDSPSTWSPIKKRKSTELDILEPSQGTPTKRKNTAKKDEIHESSAFSPKKRNPKELDVPELEQRSPTKRSPIKKCKSAELDILEPSQRTPTRRNNAAKKNPIHESPPSPPSTPSRRGGRMIAVEITCSSPEKQLRNEMQIFDDEEGIITVACQGWPSQPATAMTPSRRSSRLLAVTA
jgi:NAD-dependent histone deacetylase SIR2